MERTVDDIFKIIEKNMGELHTGTSINQIESNEES